MFYLGQPFHLLYMFLKTFLLYPGINRPDIFFFQQEEGVLS